MQPMDELKQAQFAIGLHKCLKRKAATVTNYRLLKRKRKALLKEVMKLEKMMEEIKDKLDLFGESSGAEEYEEEAVRQATHRVLNWSANHVENC